MSKIIYASKKWIESVTPIAGMTVEADNTSIWESGYVGRYYGIPIIYKPELQGKIAHVVEDCGNGKEFKISPEEYDAYRVYENWQAENLTYLIMEES